MPYFCFNAPSRAELRNVFWRGPAALATYSLRPDERFPANSWLYLCTDRAYSTENLTVSKRRDVRRGMRELRMETLSPDVLMVHGSDTFRDTLRRHGLQDATPEEFRRQIARRAKCPGHLFVGAWKGHELAASLSIVEVEDWVEINTSASADAFLRYCPNDALIFYTVSHYLVERGFRAVTFGASSIQPGSNRSSLHTFKMRIGFQAIPVHRAFTVHPLLRPFVNQLSWRGVNALLHYSPENLRLRRLSGVLECLAGENQRPLFTGSTAEREPLQETDARLKSSNQAF
jgi:hypothetical protein